MPTCKGHKDIAGIFRNAVLVNSSFHTHTHKRIFLKIIPNLGHMPSIFSPALSQAKKNLRNIGFKGQQIIILPRVPI